MTHRYGSILLFLGFLGLLAQGCRGCDASKADYPIVDLAPPDATLVGYVPDLVPFVEGLEAYAARVTRKAGAKNLARFRESTRKQFGVDPLRVSDLKTLGLDLGAGAVVFASEKIATPLLALGIADKATFEKKALELVKKTDGADKRSTEKVQGLDIHTVGRAFGDEVTPVFHWTYVQNYVVVAPGVGRDHLVLAALRMKPGPEGKGPPSVRGALTYKSLSDAVPKAPLTVFARGAMAKSMARAAEQMAQMADGLDVMTSVSVGAAGLSVDSVLGLKGTAFAGPAPKKYLDWLPKGAALAFASGAAGTDALAALRSLPQGKTLADNALGSMRRAVGVDPEKSILPLLSGPAAGAIDVKNAEALPKLIATRNMGGLTEAVHGVFVAEVKDPAAMVAALDSARGTLVSRGIEITRTQEKIAGKDAIVFEPSEARLAWAVWDNLYVYAAGPGRLRNTLADIAKGPSGLSEAVSGGAAGKLLVEKGNSVIVLRLGTIAEIATTLPGSTGLGVGAIIGAVADVLRTVGDVAVAFDVQPAGVRIRVRQELR